MRTALIRIEGANRRPIHKLQLREGTRVSDILRNLNVRRDYVLALAAEPTNHFPTEDALIADGEHFVARLRSAPVENAAVFTLTSAN